MPEIYFRHSSLRPFQAKLISDMHKAISEGNHFLAHAPCGTGKTDAALAAALTYAMQNEKDVLFLTPKISQHKIVAETILGLENKYKIGLKAADIVGRSSMCANPILKDLDYDAFYQACQKMREDGRCAYYKNAKGGNPAENAHSEILFKKVHSAYGAIKKHGDFAIEMEGFEVCPYEMMLKIAANSDLIIADYFHVLEPSIRLAFFAKIKKKLENCIIVIDEAHNLPKRVRDYLSSSLNNRHILRMEKEMEEMGGKLEYQDEFCNWAKKILDQNKGKELKIKSSDLNSALAYFGMTPDEIIMQTEAAGLAYMEKTNRKSALYRFSRFLKTWFIEKEGEVRTLKGGNEFYSLSRHSMDPSSITSILNEAYSTVLMSATLHPMEMYRDILGLDAKRTRMGIYPSPFARSNRMDLIVRGVTTKYSSRNRAEFEKIADLVDKIHESSKGGTATFFPSYAVMEKVLPYINSSPLHVQKEKLKPKELHKLAKDFSEKGGMLIAVQGGSLSEGLDFANGEIKKAIIVGIALEEMGIQIESLIEYYQKKFGKGWEYAYIYPAIVRAMQSAGRAIRKETDKAAIIYLDERFGWPNYKNLFPDKNDFIFCEPENAAGKVGLFLRS